MQSTGHTSMHASQPVQLSARTTASSLGNFLRALPAPFAMMVLVPGGAAGAAPSRPEEFVSEPPLFYATRPGTPAVTRPFRGPAERSPGLAGGSFGGPLP